MDQTPTGDTLHSGGNTRLAQNRGPRARPAGLEGGSGNGTDGQAAIVPWAGESGRCRVGNQDPVHAELSFQAREVTARETGPAGLGSNLTFPSRSELRHLGEHRGVLDDVG